MKEFLQAQEQYMYCLHITNSVGTTGSDYTIDRNCLLVRVAKFDVSIHNPTPVSTRARLLRANHYSLLDGHPGSRQMYDTMRTE